VGIWEWSYHAIKLLEHANKVMECCRVGLENKCVDEMQFGFRPGKGTTDAIFIVTQLQIEHQGKGKKLHYAFVKAFNRVP
jgi:hypothetical protein